VKNTFSEKQNGEIILTGRLAEFRIALLQEINAAKRNASKSSVSLINGKRIAQVGGSYQYVFNIENALNLPDDAPGELVVAGRSPLDVTILSIEGMVVTLSIPEDLGAFVPSARLQSDLAFLMRRLIDRIEAKAGTPNPVGDRILGAPVTGVPSKIVLPDLNTEQNEALASSLGRNTTFVWGPPGTGKTWVIGAIVEQLFRHGRSVLLVSHTNVAVDGAVKRIAERVGLDSQDLAEGKVVRVGEPKDQNLRAEAFANVLLRTHVDRRSGELAEQRTMLQTELTQAISDVKRISETIDMCEWVSTAEGDLESMKADLQGLQSREEKLRDARTKLSLLRVSSDYWNAASEAAHNAEKHLAELAEIDELLSEINDQLGSNRSKADELAKELHAAQLLLAEATSVGWLTRKWCRLPSPEEQSRVVKELEEALGEANDEVDTVNSDLETAEQMRLSTFQKVESFRSTYSAEPSEVLQSAKDHAAQIKELESLKRNLADENSATRLKLGSLFKSRCSALEHCGLVQECSTSLEGMLQDIESGFRRAVEETKSIDLQKLRAERYRLNARIRKVEGQLAWIEEALKTVEELVISEALVVATTLTRAYLRDSIQLRRFDTVVLDEASMAPIPALWIAASLADKNAVVVGDYKQLPPIVVSEHDLARKWLGTDIFVAAGVETSSVDHKVTLRWQRRMDPAIARISNKFIYDGSLSDGEETASDAELSGWYRAEWGHDSPVLLIDTGSLNAWVTSVPRGRGSSRLNFLSATVCVDLAEQLLHEDRLELQPSDKPRILIACPYRPHAKLLQLLLREQGLDRDVRAGTVHNFQGSEASIVIFDMVNDEPHWRVAMFMQQFDEGTKRLLNVALTRARRRLIILGDFDYAIRQGRHSFVGCKLIPFLRNNYPCVDALETTSSGLAARTAKAQSTVFGGDVQSDSDRLVMTQENFYEFLRSDLAGAVSRVVIYSPFITQSRLAELEPQLRAAIERGVRVYVVTKTLDERRRGGLSQYKLLERALTEWGVIVVHKRGMHEKLVFIDDRTMWEGSLNPLSFSNTREHMERRISQRVFQDYARVIRLDDLIGEYEDGSPKCPICGSEVVASEGRDEPFYWRCVQKDCYTRSIDSPPLRGGVITCAKCGGKVEYGEWGGKPAWRCLENRHHHQKVARTHLRLPRMRAVIPKRKLSELDRQFGLSSSQKNENKKTGQEQPFLFE